MKSALRGAVCRNETETNSFFAEKGEMRHLRKDLPHQHKYFVG